NRVVQVRTLQGKRHYLDAEAALLDTRREFTANDISYVISQDALDECVVVLNLLRQFYQSHVPSLEPKRTVLHCQGVGNCDLQGQGHVEVLYFHVIASLHSR